MLSANVFVVSTPSGRRSSVGLSLNALDDKDSQRIAGPSLVSVISNIAPSVLRFPGDELADGYLYFKPPYTNANTHALLDTSRFPANIGGYFDQGTATLRSNVMNIEDLVTLSAASNANIILSVSCVPSGATTMIELANVASGLSIWCQTRGIHPYAFELSDPNATLIASAIRSANSSFRVFTQGVGSVVADGFWSRNSPLANVRPFGANTPGNWFGNYVSTGLSLNSSLRKTTNGISVVKGSLPSYTVSSAVDTTRLTTGEGWPNVNDWGRAVVAADIIGKQAQYCDLVVWSSTRSTRIPGGMWSNGVYSCLTNTNGFTPIGRAIQSISQVSRGLPWCPVSVDTNLLSATVAMDSYVTGMETTGLMSAVISNKSNSDYAVTIHHPMTRPGRVVLANKVVPAILNNTTTATVVFTSGNVGPAMDVHKTTISVSAYSMNGVVFETSRKITAQPILVCPIDSLTRSPPYGVWDCRTIIPGKPVGLSGYRDMKLSTFERFNDPSTGIRRNVINCFYQVHSGGKVAANILTGGFNIASNPNVFPRSNIAVFADIFYDDAFDFGRGGKTGVGLFVGQESAAGGNYKVNSSSARCVFRANGEASLYMYVPRNLQQLDPAMNSAAYATNNYGVEFFDKDTFRAIGKSGPLRRGCWNEIGVGVRVNSFVGNAPQYDGSVFMSINGVAQEISSVRLLANTGNVYDNVSQAVFNTFYGGDWTSPANSVCKWSDVRYYDYDVVNQLRAP